MSPVRSVKKILKSKATIEGAGVHLKRAFGFSEVPLLDPFLLFDDFHSNVPEHYLKGFPWHPHRGIETITYVLHGDVDHGDSMGNSGSIGPGDVQWMTAGSGVIHQEMPRGDQEGLLWGFQLWANLPAADKMMGPRYRDVKAAAIPEIRMNNGVTVRLICGELEGRKGPVRDIVIDPEYLDVTMPPGTTFAHPTHPNHTVLAYVIEGTGHFCREKDPYAYEVEGKNYFDMQREPFAERESLLLFDAGDRVEVSTEKGPVRFLLLSGKPIGEPVAWYGPIVMNTQEELRAAFEEYHNGTFIRDSGE
jgi:redox-sensitive bicupin YhaK (pirin superfamily)